MEEGLLKKTGHNLEHWVKVVKESKLEKHTAIMNFLKQEHGFTHGFANFVAHKSRKSDAASHDADELVETQYKGKEVLRPIYEKLKAEMEEFGDDVTITPKKAAVSFIRKKQFALVKPATKTRIDLGLKIKGKETTDRLENSGPFGTMCTHRVRLTEVDQVDEELLGWIKEAYEANG